MTDRRGSLLLNDEPFDETGAPAPMQPVTTGQVIGAHARLSYQDWAGAPEQDVMDAYGPLVTALSDKGNPVNNYVAVGGANPVNDAAVWRDIQKYRQSDPTFLKDIPASNADQFGAWVQSRRAGQRQRAQDVVSRQSGTTQGLIGFGTDLGVSMGDPINLSSMVLTGGGSATESLLATTAREALINGATQAAQLPVIAQNRAQFGEDMTADEMLGDVGLAAAAGATFHLGARGIIKSGEAITRKFTGKTDAEVAAHFDGVVPDGSRTDDEQSALHVINRDTENRSASPFVDNPAGMNAHASRLDQALAAIMGLDAADRASLSGGTALSTGTVSPPPLAGISPGLTPDSVVNFVMTDLEGGAKVVHYSDADGGVTKYGIAAAANPGVDVASLTRIDAARIAKSKYWLPEFDNADPRTAAVAFDASYIGGPDLGRRILIDSGGDPARALELYRTHLDHIADTVPGKEKYRAGWNNRVDKLARFVGEGDDRVRVKPDLEGYDEADIGDAQRMLDLDNADTQISDVERAPELADDAQIPDVEKLSPVLEGSALPEGQAITEILPSVTENPEPARDISEDQAATVDEDSVQVPIAEAPPQTATEYVDRYLSGEGQGTSNADQQLAMFADNHAMAIGTEFQDRFENQRSEAPAPELAQGTENTSSVANSGSIAAQQPITMRSGAALSDIGSRISKMAGSPHWEIAPRLTREMKGRGVEVAIPQRKFSEMLRRATSERDFERRVAIDATRAAAMPESRGWPSPAALSAAGEIAVNDADVRLAALVGKAFSDPIGEASRAQMDGIAHDLRQAIEAGQMPNTPFAAEGVEAGGGDHTPIYQRVKDVLDQLDADDAAIAALKDCL